MPAYEDVKIQSLYRVQNGFHSGERETRVSVKKASTVSPKLTKKGIPKRETVLLYFETPHISSHYFFTSYAP